MTDSTIEMSVIFTYPEESSATGITGFWLCVWGKKAYIITKNINE